MVQAGTRRQKSLDDFEGNWKNHLAPRVASMEACNITVDSANKLMSDIFKDSTPSVRDKCLTIMKAVFAHHPTNPFQAIKKCNTKSRERVLTLEELKRFFDAMEAEAQIYQDVVMLLLITAQRKMCVLSMEWSELHLSSYLWLIPQSKMKGKNIHGVPLVSQAVEILHRRYQEAPDGAKYVFPSDRSKSGHIVDKSGESGFWKRITKKANLFSDDLIVI
ncbi:tyrosine-type recombinase/integrase [Paraferrimonas sp. SM1919]|uniref:tyrosine-type recombinase/integrase n=1 Tax=Paraferrimonas sp. SM1919 TaxID=2662263 RepID=UPI001969C92E|nr:tyrosine-type recombinase/integrase [Paraferrimonas sp. SM1919]